MTKTHHLEHPPLLYIVNAFYNYRLGNHIEGISLRVFELALVMSISIRYHCSFLRRSPDI